MISAVLRELIAAGLSGEALIAAVERVEATMAPAPRETGKAARNRRYYEAHRDELKAKRDAEGRLKATESDLNQTFKTVSDGDPAENGSPHLSCITTPEKKDLPSEDPKKRGANEDAGLAAVAALRAVGPIEDDATALHDAAETALVDAGFRVQREFPVTLPSGRSGRIDLVGWFGGGTVAIELDCRMPRAKSVAKMAQIDAFRIAGIRSLADTAYKPADVDALVGFTVHAGEVRAKTRPHLLPIDFTPGDRSRNTLEKLDRSAAWGWDALDEMRDWADGTGAKKVDWDATLAGWMRRKAQNEHGRNRAPPGGRDSSATTLLKRDAAERARNEQSASRDDFWDSAGGADAGGRSPSGAAPQRHAMGGPGPILDLEPIRSFGR